MYNTSLRINLRSLELVKKLIDNPERYGVIFESTSKGATIIDAGIKAKGGYLAGQIITEICLGGLGKTTICPVQYNDLELPSIFVYTNYPSISTLGSQFAGWRIEVDNYVAIGSGPARALSLKPKKLFTKIDYKDESDTAILVLETGKKPTDKVIEHIAKECKVSPKKLYLIVTPTSSLAGSIQISGRIVETAIHKLTEVGFDPKNILYASGNAPIAPIHPKFMQAMGRTNDAIIFAGQVYLIVAAKGNEDLSDLTMKVPASCSPSYGKLFNDVFKEADYDFYKIDPGLFAPAMITINDVVTGNTYRSGKINTKLLSLSFGVSTN